MSFREVKFTVKEDQKKARSGKDGEYYFIELEQGETGTILGLHDDFATSKVKHVLVRLDDGGDDYSGSEGWVPRDALEVGRGWPYVAAQSWDPERAAQKSGNPKAYRANFKDAIRIRRHEEGKILAYSNDFAWVHVTAPRLGTQGWVPTTNIIPGVGRKYGDIKVVNSNPVLGVGVDVEDNPQPTRVGQVILALLTAIHGHRDKIPSLEPWAREGINTAGKRQKLATAMVAGFDDAETLDCFNNDECTLQDLLDAALSPTDAEAGLYAWLYTKMRKGLARFYTGSTVDTRGRMSSYNRPSGRATIHRSVANNADHQQSLLLCDLPPNDTVLQFWSEQITFLLTGSYIPEWYESSGTDTDIDVSKPPPSVQHGAAVEIAVNQADAGTSDQADEDLIDAVDLDKEDEDPEDGEDPDSAEAVTRRRGAKYSIMKATGIAFIAVSKEVFGALGYTAMTHRDTFGGSYGQVAGLNLQSPTCTSSSKPIWSKFRLPSEKITVYRRVTSMAADQSGGLRIRLSLSGGGHGGGRLEVTSTLANFGAHPPSAGDRVQLVCEVTDGHRHPRSFAGLPTVCYYDDDHRASTLALRLEWYKGGQWWTKYLNAGALIRNVDHAQGALNGLGRAIGILNMLERCVIRSDQARAFDYILASARIVEICFDNLTQEIRVVEDTSPLRAVATGDARDIAELQASLQIAGAAGFNVADLGPPGAGGRRWTCDRCALGGNRARGWTPPPPIKIEQTRADFCDYEDEDHCKSCWKHGVPCTYTPTAELKGNRALQFALWGPITLGQPQWKAMSLPDPQLETTMVGMPGHMGGPPILLDKAKLSSMYKDKTVKGQTAVFEYLKTVAFANMNLAKFADVFIWHSFVNFASRLNKKMAVFDAEFAAGKQPNEAGRKMDELRNKAVEDAYNNIPGQYTSRTFKDDAGNYIVDRLPTEGEVKRMMEGDGKNASKDMITKVGEYLENLAVLYAWERDDAKALGRVATAYIREE